mmetsp:Transcript_25283/g.31158  ORF Transcript_25283/g.31158 Transcript_25283/m.31158 type:complete len:358 (+) Transcript_25283:155-1228(+)
MADYYANSAYTRSSTSSSATGNNYYYSDPNSDNDPYSSNNSNPYASQAPAPVPASSSANQPAYAAAAPNTAAASATPAFWNPAMASTIASAAINASGNMNNPNTMIDLSMKMGHTFLDQGTARMIPGLERFMRNLRVYFAVDNGYVKRKMLRVLGSVFFKNWNRIHLETSGPMVTELKYALPINDDNAPDLYIPFMSLITYVLLSALCYGTAGQFHPEVLSDVTTKCFATQVLEVIIFKALLYSMKASSTAAALNMTNSFLDLFAITGYKYLSLTLNLIFGYTLSLFVTVGGSKGYYAMFVWTGVCLSYFMLKTMANQIPLSAGSNGTGPKREFVVLGMALSQFVSLWFLGQTQFLN